jgi:hypothetical protein
VIDPARKMGKVLNIAGNDAVPDGEIIFQEYTRPGVILFQR